MQAVIYSSPLGHSALAILINISCLTRRREVGLREPVHCAVRALVTPAGLDYLHGLGLHRHAWLPGLILYTSAGFVASSGSKVLCWICLAASSCPMASSARARMPEDGLAGLGAQWEQNETVRRRVCWDNSLLAWRSAEQVGVPSYDMAAINHDTLYPFFELWSSKTSRPRSPQVCAILPEARLAHAQLAHMYAGRNTHIHMYPRGLGRSDR